MTVDSPSGRRVLEVPEAARIDDLVPSLVEVCEPASDPAGWSLAPLGERTLAGDETLGRRGLFSGAVLVLVAPDEHLQLEPEPAARPAAGEAAPRPNIDRIRDADYLRLLDAAIAAPGSGASMVIAVISTQAGAGSTTITALLATLLGSLRNDEVGAVDGSPQSGALSHWMAPDSGLSGAAYRSLFEPPPSPERVRGAMVRIGRGLALLPAPSDHGLPSADEPAWALLVQHLRHLHNIVVVDCGAGFQRPAGRAALDAADHVVLVSKAGPGDLGKLGQTISSIQRRGRTVVVLANQTPRPSRIKTSAAGVQQVTLAYEQQPARRLKTRGFAWSDAPYAWQESIRELAAVLVGSLQSG